jgi:proteasome lid subunit RPN8/RPN11
MSDDIQFGDVEEAQPQKDLRPDRNRHFAVVAYGKPVERDLPIFVDLDVLMDMEAHAATDTSVELGGVMLGGHYHDEDGKPFVVVTDTLRAEHYESTKGSFKFTHETWEKISRQRDEFPEDLQMAGWYHTHPDWGVFLSGMDMFICDHFFNKPLDVAYVIDPCRLDRAFFQWTGKPSERVRRTGGFYVMASRFRQAELEQTVQALEGKIPMPSYSGTPGSPVIHVQAPHQPPKPAWEGLAMMGMLAVQFCVLALIAWKAIGPQDGGTAAAIAKLEKAMEARDESARLAAQSEHDLKVIDRVVGEMRDTSTGFVERYRNEIQRSADMEKAVRNSQAVQTQIEKNAERTLQLKQDELDKQKLAQAKLEDEMKELTEERTKLKKDLDDTTALAKALDKKLNPDKEDEEVASTAIFVWPPTQRTWIVIGVTIAALSMLGVAGYWFSLQGQTVADESLLEDPPRSRSPEPHLGESPQPIVKDVNPPPEPTEAAR